MLKRRDAFFKEKRAGSEYGPAALSSGSGSGYFNRTDSTSAIIVAFFLGIQ